MTIELNFKPYTDALIDDAVAETERNQDLVIYQLPNYHVLFAIPTDMYEAFFHAMKEFLSSDQQHELLMTLGSRSSAIAEQAEYEEFLRDQEGLRSAAFSC